MGGEKVTSQKLKVVKVDADKNLLLIKGAVPGPRNGLLLVKNSVKAS
jgi:large subunit ribosomal protein L3